MDLGRRTGWLGLATAATVVALAASTAFAADGDLDPTFEPTPAPAGSLATAFADDDSAAGVALQADGKIVVAGTSTVVGTSPPSRTSSIAVARYLPDGTLDDTFSGDGKLVESIGLSAAAVDVRVQPDGKIVVAGFFAETRVCTTASVLCPALQGFVVVRYNSDGSRDDAGFGTTGTGGIVKTTVGADGIAAPNGMTLQSDGKIVLVGFARSGGDNDFAVVRYNSNGTLDQDFDGSSAGNGIVLTSVQGDDAGASEVIAEPDGKLAVAGSAAPTAGGFPGLAMARYEPDGRLDTTFSPELQAGTVVVSLGSTTEAYGGGLAVQSDGRYLVGGSSYTSDGAGYALARFTRAGQLDTTFNAAGTPGYQITGFPQIASSFGTDLVVDASDRIVVVGEVITSANSDRYEIGLVRYTPSGALDTSFGSDGTVRTAIVPGFSRAHRATLQTDGRLLVVGEVYAFPTRQFAVIRYVASAPLARGSLEGEPTGGGLQRGGSGSELCGSISARPSC